MSQVVESPFIVVEFKRNLVSIPHAAMTMISKMVKFRDVYSFRAAIRPHYDSQTSALYFLTSDLNKIGVKVLKVTYSWKSVTRWDQETLGSKIATLPAFEHREKKLFRVRLEVNQPTGEQQNPATLLVIILSQL